MSSEAPSLSAFSSVSHPLASGERTARPGGPVRVAEDGLEALLADPLGGLDGGGKPREAGANGEILKTGHQEPLVLAGQTLADRERKVAEIKSQLARRKAPLGSEALATRVRRTLTDLGNMFRSGPEDAKKEAAVFQEPGSLPTLKSLPMTTRTWTASKAFPSSRVSPVAFSL